MSSVIPVGVSKILKSQQVLQINWSGSSSGWVNTTLNGWSCKYKDFSISAVSNYLKTVCQFTNRDSNAIKLVCQLVGNSTLRVYSDPDVNFIGTVQIMEFMPNFNVYLIPCITSTAQTSKSVVVGSDTTKNKLIFNQGILGSIGSQISPTIYYDSGTDSVVVTNSSTGNYCGTIMGIVDVI